MQKIRDERLKMKNLQNIRTAYILQTIGILGILAYDWITKGIEGMTKNPLWFVFILTAVISAFLSLDISVAHEDSEKSPNKGLIVSLAVLVLISFCIGYLNTLGEELNLKNGFILGGVVFYLWTHSHSIHLLFKKKKQR
ncbi:hypothetical protein [Caldifermentibacillus hisashii]|uniref:hypothetical protein n=1 Tax=Caldifermentibacillus hisashii TaxID=996558 RepID=UPI002AC33A5E|nr:hypothetical protein [Caldifermentibacillus hisashii]